MGVHVTFVRSTELDKWKPSEMEAMKRGGNGNARSFFRSHGIKDMEQSEQKYHSRAATMYRTHLKKVGLSVCDFSPFRSAVRAAVFRPLCTVSGRGAWLMSLLGMVSKVLRSWW